MALIPVDTSGQLGIIKDTSPFQLPPNAWSDGNNVRLEHGAVLKSPGYDSVIETCPIAPYYITQLKAGTAEFWIVAGLTKIYAHNGTSWTDLTRTSGDYNATAAENWTHTVIGGVLVMTNFVDDPQEWPLSSGIPSVSNKMQDLSNWPASTECKSLRSFRSFLIGLNITKSSVPNSRVVKWSTEAPVNAVPVSWDENNATLDAGEYSLEDTKGAILDGLPLQDTFMIYKEDSVYAMTYVGTPFIFAFRQISPTVGVLAKNCVTEFDGGHFIFGNGDIYINDGQRLKSILPHKMRDYLFGYIDGDHYKKSFCVTDYNRSEVLACFPSADNTTGQVNKALVWNWNENTFSLRDLPDLGHIAYGTIEDESSLTTWASATPTWSTVSGTWSTSWDVVGNVLVFASPINTKVYRDRVGYQADGVNMRSYIERTGYTMDEQNNPDQSTVKHIKAVWPKMRIDKNDSVDFYIGTQMSTEEAVSWEGPISFNPDTQSKVSCRASGKLYGIRIESDNDSEWRLEGLSFEVQNAGRRGSRSYS